MRYQLYQHWRQVVREAWTHCPPLGAAPHARCWGQNQTFLLRHGRLTWTTSRRLQSTSAASSNIFKSPRPDVEIPDNVPFHQYMFERFDLFKDLPAVQDFVTGKTYSYSQLKEKAVRVASALHRLGYRKGDVLMAFSINHLDLCILMLACSCLGVWYTAANPAFTAEELARQLQDSGAVAVFTVPPLAEVVKAALDNKEFPSKVQKLFAFGEAPGFQPFQTLLDDDGKDFPDVDINPREDVFVLPYSSGTTGLPKGVMLTHYNILANCLQMGDVAEIREGERALALLPFYHIYGMVVIQYCLLNGGGHIFTLPRFEPESFLKCLLGAKIELAHLVPPLITFLTKHPVVAKFDLSALERVICAAAPLGEDLTEEFKARFPSTNIGQGFGLTETSPATNLDGTYSKPGSVGHLMANTLGKIVDLETNESLGPGQQGEYCVKGPQIMKGYYHNQAATDAMVTSDGWLHTGDIGYYTEDGSVYIKDRMKELIKYKGSQVAPAELEALLLGHTDISDVAVVGVPDDEAGELPKAFVVKAPGAQISEEDIVKFVEEKLAPSKRLRGGVQFVEEIPRNPSGKILRRVIKEMYVTLAS